MPKLKLEKQVQHTHAYTEKILQTVLAHLRVHLAAPGTWYSRSLPSQQHSAYDGMENPGHAVKAAAKVGYRELVLLKEMQ